MVTTGRRVRLVYLSGVAVLLVVLAYRFSTGLISQTSPQACGISPPEIPSNPFLGNQFGTVGLCFVAAGVGFIVGRLTAKIKGDSFLRSLLLGYEGAAQTATNTKAKVLVEVGLIVMLVFGTGALYYESFAFWNGDWPVTFYVRCANDVSPVWAAAAAAALSVLMGNWLWHEHEDLPAKELRRKQS